MRPILFADFARAQELTQAPYRSEHKPSSFGGPKLLVSPDPVVVDGRVFTASGLIVCVENAGDVAVSAVRTDVEDVEGVTVERIVGHLEPGARTEVRLNADPSLPPGAGRAGALVVSGKGLWGVVVRARVALEVEDFPRPATTEVAAPMPTDVDTARSFTWWRRRNWYWYGSTAAVAVALICWYLVTPDTSTSPVSCLDRKQELAGSFEKEFGRTIRPGELQAPLLFDAAERIAHKALGRQNGCSSLRTARESLQALITCHPTASEARLGHDLFEKIFSDECFRK